MKKILFTFFLVLISLLGFSQSNRTQVLSIPHADSSFTNNVPVGTIVLDTTAKVFYKISTYTTSGTTLAAANKAEVSVGGGTLEQTLALGDTTGANNIGVSDSQYLYYKNSGFTNRFITQILSANHTQTLQNKTGVLAHLDDITGGDNIYTTSDTLDTNRTVYGNGYMLNIDNTLNVDSGYYLGSNLWIHSTMNGNPADVSRGCTFVGYGQPTLQGSTTDHVTGIGARIGGTTQVGKWTTLIGSRAGLSMTGGGHSNTYVGYDAGSNTITGDANTTIGASTRAYGAGGTAVGFGADAAGSTFGLALGYDATVSTSTNATAIGYNSLASQDNTIILGNGTDVGIGTSTPDAKLEVVGISDTSADTALKVSSLNNLAFSVINDGMVSAEYGYSIAGSKVFSTNTSGAEAPTGSNLFVGYNSGTSNIGSNNIGVGLNALATNTNGNHNTAIGVEAIENAASADYNVAVGYKAMETAGNAQSSVGVGYNTYGSSYNGSLGVALGYQAGTKALGGTGSTYIGANSGAIVNSGWNYSIGLGYGALVGASNQMVIGDKFGVGYIGEMYLGQGISHTDIVPTEFKMQITSITGTNVSPDYDFIIAGSQGTGDRGGGNIIFQTGLAGTTGTTPNVLTTAMTIDSAQAVTVTGTVINPHDSIPDNDATPSVAGRNVWEYNGVANSVTITDLDNPRVGAFYTIIGNSDTYTLTINDGGNFSLSGGVNFTMGAKDVIVLYCLADNDYIEISRSDN